MHFSKKKLKKIRSVKQVRGIDKTSAHWKPKGIWISDESANLGWKEWCTREEYNLEGLSYAHEIVLSSLAKILYIKSAKELDEFFNKYKCEIYPQTSIYGIKWSDVASEYDGIIITPYLWERRLDPATSFYYGWDCASGCIWNSKAIKEVKLVEK
jgi:hypothetical protein